jgi:hypothetical protein
MLRIDTQTIEAGRDRMGLDDLAVLVHQETGIAVQDTSPSAHDRGGVLAGTHPSDLFYWNASMEGFAHAMAFSLAARSRLYFLHVAGDEEDYSSYTVPHVNRLLGLWGKIAPMSRRRRSKIIPECEFRRSR